MITSLLKTSTRLLQPLYLVMLTLLGHLSPVRIYPLLEMVRVLVSNPSVPRERRRPPIGRPSFLSLAES